MDAGSGARKNDYFGQGLAPVGLSCEYRSLRLGERAPCLVLRACALLYLVASVGEAACRFDSDGDSGDGCLDSNRLLASASVSWVRSIFTVLMKLLWLFS